MRGRYYGNDEITWGEHFQKHGYSSTRVGKIFHMRVPGATSLPELTVRMYLPVGHPSIIFPARKHTRLEITPALISTSSQQNWKDANPPGCRTECL